MGDKVREALEAFLSAKPQCECTDEQNCSMAAARKFAREALASLISPPKDEESAKLAECCEQFMVGAKKLYEIDANEGDMWFFELYHHLNDCATALRLSRPVTVQEWQPIETAPKDGTRILIYGDTRLRGVPADTYPWMPDWNIGSWAGECWHDEGDGWIIAPTYWVPLPALPSPPKPEG